MDSYKTLITTLKILAITKNIQTWSKKIKFQIAFEWKVNYNIDRIFRATLFAKTTCACNSMYAN